MHPLDVIIEWIRKHPKARIADFGCGEARLAATVPNKVSAGGGARCAAYLSYQIVSCLPRDETGIFPATERILTRAQAELILQRRVPSLPFSFSPVIFFFRAVGGLALACWPLCYNLRNSGGDTVSDR